MGARFGLLKPFRPRQVAAFGVVGVLATCVHFLMLTFCVETLSIGPTAANGVAFSVAVLVSYGGQSLWVFHREMRDFRQLCRFATSAVGGLVGNVATMALVVHVIRLHYYAGFLLALIVVPAATFLVNKFWVFGGQAAR